MRDQMTSNREAELKAIPRIGSGDWLGHWRQFTVNINKEPHSKMKKEYINKMLTSAKQDIDDALAALEKNDSKAFECHLQMSKDAIKCAANMQALDKMHSIGM